MRRCIDDRPRAADRPGRPVKRREQVALAARYLSAFEYFEASAHEIEHRARLARCRTTNAQDRSEYAIRLAVNVGMYVLCSDYKDDQVHTDYLLHQRRWKVNPPKIETP